MFPLPECSESPSKIGEACKRPERYPVRIPFTALLPFSFAVVVTTYTLNQAVEPSAGRPKSVESATINISMTY